MSYDVELAYGDKIAQVENHEEGGTYVLGGTTDAWLNITYNYTKNYAKVNSFSIYNLDGKIARDTIPVLERAVSELGAEKYDGPYFVKHSAKGEEHDTGGYWKPTDGNAGYAAFILLTWAKQHPDALWHVS